MVGDTGQVALSLAVGDLIDADRDQPGQAPLVDLELRAGLAAARADPPPPAQTDADDHPLRTEADVDDRGAAQAQQPLECRGDAHVVLLSEPLSFITQQPASEGGGASSPC